MRDCPSEPLDVGREPRPVRETAASCIPERTPMAPAAMGSGDLGGDLSRDLIG